MQWDKFSEHVERLDSAIAKLPEHFCAGEKVLVPWALSACLHPICRAMFCSMVTPDFTSPSSTQRE